MKHTKKERTLYDDSLLKIFIKSGSTVFIFLLIVFTAIYFLMLYKGYMASERIKLMKFCFVLTVLCSYGPATISMFKVWRQERTLGIYWKNRTDRDRPVQERDWHLDYDRGGFILCHRAYIKRILRSKMEKEITRFDRGMVYCMMFEDINGKKHTLKFSSKDGQQGFRQWYEKQMVKHEVDENLDI